MENNPSMNKIDEIFKAVSIIRERNAILNPTPQLPNEVAKKHLHLFFIADHSGSMFGKKIASLNQAIREAIPEVKKAISAHPQVEVFLRAIRFSDLAQWHVGPQPVALENFFWPNLSVEGGTATSKALRLLSSELTTSKMPRRGFPPVIILVSDGYCTDPFGEYDKSITELLNLPWGRKSVRLVIGIGDESGYNERELLKFVSHPEVGVLKAHTPEELTAHIKWATVTGTISSSQSKSAGSDGTSQNVILTPPPSTPTPTNKADVY